MLKKQFNQLIKKTVGNKVFWLAGFLFLTVPLATQAGILPPCAVNGNCGFCDLLYTINTLMRVLTYIAGVAALGFMIYGGILFVTSAGNKSQVQKGTTAMKNAIFGTIVILISWVAVNFLIIIMTGSKNISLVDYVEKDGIIKTVWGDRAWYDICMTYGKEGETYNDKCQGKGDGYPCGGDGGSHCESGKCEPGPACAWLKANGGKAFANFSCQEPSACGISYAECGLVGNCFKNLCNNKETVDGEILLVCCDPNPPSPVNSDD